MNGRFVVQQDSHDSSSGSPSVSSRSINAGGNRSFCGPVSSFSVGMVDRVCRARWFLFLRRAFHHQNSFRSNIGPNPFDSNAWMLLEFLALVIQISTITFTLGISKGEKPAWPLRVWIVGYDVGCVLSLLLLYGRYVHLYLTLEMGFSFRDLEQQTIDEDSRCSRLMNKCHTSLELFFAVWFVMGNVWFFDSRFGSFHQAPQLHVLCLSLLALNAVSYTFPFLLFLLLCCCIPVTTRLLGYNMNMGFVARGAPDDQIFRLPSWRCKITGATAIETSNHTDLNSSPTTNEECCICLCKYKDEEEVRRLPCSHMFHLGCVDKWLKLVSCCPLCKQELMR